MEWRQISGDATLVEQHVGHHVEVTTFGDTDVTANIAIVCEDWQTVLVDWEPEDDGDAEAR